MSVNVKLLLDTPLTPITARSRVNHCELDWPIYVDDTDRTLSQCAGYAGSLNHELTDARDFVNWGGFLSVNLGT